MNTKYKRQLAIVFDTMNEGLAVKPCLGSTIVTGVVELDTLQKSIGWECLLDIVGREKAKLHFGLVDAPLVPVS